MRISVITPTWRRHDLLIDRCIPSVAAQTMPVEHVVVSDGPDPELANRLADVAVVYAELAEHPNDETNVGAHSRNHGLTIATGDLIAHLDDDNAYRPHHIATLAAALTGSDADFAYSRMVRLPGGDLIGSEPPRHGTIDSSLLMHRRDTHLKFGLWPPAVYALDWELVKGWLERGARWVFVPDVTVDYYYSR